MPIKEIKIVQHRGKSGKGRLYEKQIAHCECDQCGKTWEARRFDAGKPYTFCSRSCSNLASLNGGKVDELKRQSCLEKYGVDNPLKSAKVWDRRKKTCLERYGVEHVQHTDEWKEKRRLSIHEKYGDELFKTEEFKKKRRETFGTKYGVKSPLEVEEFKEKYRQTCLANHGVEYPLQSAEIVRRVHTTCRKVYGCLPWNSDTAQRKAYKARLGYTREEYLETLPEYEAYRSQVRHVTEKQPLNTLENFDKDRSRTGYHLDHIYSVRRGFLDRIPPEVIGNICNLRFISAVENRKKGKSCGVTKKELLERYERQISEEN